jgi:hypothetical protein
MKIKVINDKVQDSIVFEGKTIADIQVSAMDEMKKRGWKHEDCYSVPIDAGVEVA